MYDWLDKKCKIEVRKGGSLFYTGVIIAEDDNTITFKDREGKLYTFNKSKIIEIYENEG